MKRPGTEPEQPGKESQNSPENRARTEPEQQIKNKNDPKTTKSHREEAETATAPTPKELSDALIGDEEQKEKMKTSRRKNKKKEK